MLVIGEESANVLLTVRPSVSSLTAEVVIPEIPGVILNILGEPVLGILVLSPVIQPEKIGAFAVPQIVFPFADIQIALAIEVCATSIFYTGFPVTVVISAL